ncbi:hypothetical protein E8E15_004616 [Penicillium rubens]|uniref:Pc22g16420 protein n=2 Tax=Penicillium chrysogenum species complex TaxID=254878 RepID=B6HR48_PENRW|nr:uncharacterized protein N7525_004747 [Penicillium rubens]XP_056563853.1 uncharacterized protein N7489_010482 [Penicillium chrysogenum]CAP98930.1 Pc22g16420 [Penicillium rubens Wisconsin 54-1255]KAF3027298.1 hypothetical protein E8E15_004616 [Penicillium rubens]KAJ5044511.1 hypothetical protein NUH16_001317 [Penicillium rubens]KAJ5229774.1 hypothetical protein N7489_010482 [Penicillium chrysogenum]KAJ5259178.1 hypothetical protein N7524_010734 [Penicillium chrysogenum]
MPHFPKDSGFSVKDASSAQNAVKVKNRRKRYLDLHPEYFSAGLELADPLLYDRLIRRFQTAQEREAEGRAKGFSGVLETDLLRSEAKIDAIANPDPNAMMSYTRGPDGEILAEDRDEIPPNKEEGERLWRWEMGLRFMQGNDIDFDYKTVDENDDLDDHTDEQDQYFEDEEPEWVVDSTRGDDARPNLQGETGIQDF